MFSEQNLHKFGTSLPLLELDQVPSKKPLYVQDQIATDEQGRRRFHGAFTGGFSAGYWNTVGSKEGWTPQSFKSSRTEKASEKLQQRPEDFMDDEDRGEFGIAPKSIKINEDFTSAPEQSTEKRKRKFLQNDLQPIPGEPVLQQLIKPIKDKAAVRILKTWGWRPGQGIGPRQTRKEKKKARERNKKELYLMEKYGCEIPSSSNKNNLNTDDEGEEDDEDSEEEDDEITFAPEDCELPPCQIKQDRYGIGYEPLSRQSVLGGNLMQKPTEHINLFQALETVGKNNQKISFTGQAFGVGALEEDDDEDVYALDDMTRYDFSLEDKKSKKIKKKFNVIEDLVFGEFMLDRNPSKLPVYKVEIPFGWHPRNWYEKRSRFEPLDPRKQRHLDKIFNPNSQEQNMTREKRAELLDEELRKTQQTTSIEKPRDIKKKSVEELQQEYKERKEKTKSLLEKITAKSSSFTKGGIISIEGEEKPFSAEDISSAFKPFATDERKQKRYEMFLAKEFKNEAEIEEFLKTIQPVELSLWDRQMELKEFQQAKKLYRPLKGIMSDRFITESEIKAVESETKKVDNKQIIVERTKQMWKPHSLLCKRYNIAEPFKGLMEDDKKSKSKQKKLSVFDYLETSINKKEDFQTPVIIPKHIEKPQEIIKQTNEMEQQTTSTNSKQVEGIPKETVALEWQEVLNPSEKPSKEKQSFTFKPKTDLEKQVVESINKPVAEKKELFKSIFSDSESEEEEEETNKMDSVTQLSKPLNAAAANLLRNNSPPRGIFKALFSSNNKETEKELEKEKVKEPENNHDTVAKDSTNITPENTRVLFKPKSTREPKELQTPEEVANIYGPALPKTLTTNKSLEDTNAPKSSIDDKLLDLYQKHKPKLQVTEKWIEKDLIHDSTDTDDSSDDSDSSSSSAEELVKKKKKLKKSKKKKSSDHKHKKHKDNKSGKKSRKHDKKKKKHKKK
ncbi:G patch domain-containing protein 1 homolog [Lucilia cuprina]|uniref:G patch domain-containing protein 1 homolog n=1 Tax=Lucilia cuprina TaxID=7375 RepID=UPI001F0659D5|nr:G patch domain-containing protein 1 homolog [Lucilia cuprina]